MDTMRRIPCGLKCLQKKSSLVFKYSWLYNQQVRNFGWYDIPPGVDGRQQDTAIER
jgi:hypothetical protein